MYVRFNFIGYNNKIHDIILINIFISLLIYLRSLIIISLHRIND